MRILGVDPGLQVTGYGVIESERGAFQLVKAGVLTTSSAERIEKRLDRIHKDLAGVIKEHRPEVLILEKLYSHYKHPVTAILMGHARGVICVTAGECRIPVVSYPVKRIRQALTGTGSASKLQVQKMVVNLLRVEEQIKYTDISDALALAIGHSYMERGRL